MNNGMRCVSSHRCLVSLVVRRKEFRLKRFISLEEINLSGRKQNYRFYLFDKSWDFSVKYVILSFIIFTINDTSFELSVFCLSDTESRINELKFSDL